MSTPKREDFPPGLEGLKAYKRALGEDVDPAGPWDPKKWGSGAEGYRFRRPTGKLKLENASLEAEIYADKGTPPSDLRVRWVSEVPGREGLNALWRGVHPMELQKVLPAVVDGEQLVLAAQPAGGPMLPSGRPAVLLDPGRAGGAWSVTLSDDDDEDGVTHEGERQHLVLLAMLYADVVLGSLADPPPRLPWIAPVRRARDALRAEAGDSFAPVRG